MNESMVYADNFSKTFAGEGDFLNFLKNREEETTWKKETSKYLVCHFHYEKICIHKEYCDHIYFYRSSNVISQTTTNYNTKFKI